jgi:hypothetical protein
MVVAEAGEGPVAVDQHPDLGGLRIYHVAQRSRRNVCLAGGAFGEHRGVAGRRRSLARCGGKQKE